MMETKECRQSAGRQRTSAIMFSRILLAIDDSESSEPAISFAVAMAKSSGGSVRVVHVNEYLVGGRGVTLRTQADATALLAGVVLKVAGVPNAGVLAFAVLVLGILQIGSLPILLPVAI